MQKMATKIKSDADRNDFIKATDERPDSILEQITAYINRKEQTTPRGVADKGMHCDETRRFLLVFDNCEEIVSAQSKKFADLLSKFIDECKHLTIVATSRQALPVLKDSKPPTLYHALAPLKPIDAVKLFV